MIREYETVMSDSDLNKKDWFPNFIIVRKGLKDGRDSKGKDSENRWDGMLKEVEKIVKAEMSAIKNDQQKVNSRIENDMKLLKKMITENQEREAETLSVL